jgi:hypothetical protein
MRKVMLSSMLAFAAMLFVVSTAMANYCKTEQCPAGSAKTSHTICCEDPGAPSGAPSSLCGQVVVGGTNVIGGCISASGASGCIDDQDPGAMSACGNAAADACQACGCFVDSGCN